MSGNWFDDILGTSVLYDLHQDAFTLMAAKVVRLFSFGFLSVMLVNYLKVIGFSDDRIGLLFTLTLVGDMFISLFMTSHADRWGRKKNLIFGSLLSIVTGITFSFQTNFWLLLVSAIFGVISPSGNEVGPFMAIELSAISQVSRENDRTKLMAWYNLVGSFATAAGALFCGACITYLTDYLAMSVLGAYRTILIIYTICQVVKLYCFTLLTDDVEVPTVGTASVKNVNPVSLFLGLHQSKWIVLQLSILFTLDSFAGAFVLQSFIAAWFTTTYATKEQTLGLMLFVCNFVAGISALFAVKIAELVGLVMTMVVTHLPSNILLILVPLMPNEFWAIIMISARFCISQMDVPTRNAYVQSRFYAIQFLASALSNV